MMGRDRSQARGISRLYGFSRIRERVFFLIGFHYYAFMNIMWGGGIRALKTGGGGGVSNTEAKKWGILN